jgi:hypothetical protein
MELMELIQAGLSTCIENGNHAARFNLRDGNPMPVDDQLNIQARKESQLILLCFSIFSTNVAVVAPDHQTHYLPSDVGLRVYCNRIHIGFIAPR